MLYEPDQVIKEKKKKILVEELLPFYLQKLDELAATNHGHLAVKKITWADLYLTAFVDYLNYALEGVFHNFEGYENLQKVMANTLAIKNIKKWVQERPKTPF
jgi:glutathione S-transferase